jgi:hypothetical protein
MINDALFPLRIERSLKHIEETRDELNSMIKPFLEKRVDDYKQRFGEFDRMDRDLWYNLNVSNTVEDILHAARDDV